MKPPSNMKDPPLAFFSRARWEMLGVAGFFILFVPYLWLRLQPSIRIQTTY
jgi:hypothetical protein